VIRGLDGLAVYLGGRDVSPDEALCEAWIAAANAATGSLGSAGRIFEWTALLGPPTPGVIGQFPPLAESVLIGQMTLTPQPDPVEEFGTSPTPSLSSFTTSCWWPILAEGSDTAYAWTAATKKAGFALRRLCAFLSVVLDACVVTREAPAPREWGVRKAPRRPSWQRDDVGPESKFPEGSPPADQQMFPVEMVAVWDDLPKRPWLAHALEIYHEGLLTDFAHPSLALVAYTAAIEAIANHLFTASRCPTCNTHTLVAAKFRTTLRLVLTEEEADRLGQLYSPRSRTVHEGRLHGSEGMAGHFVFGYDNAELGFLAAVLRLRGAARDLLLLALRHELPARRDLPAELIPTTDGAP
jgi:hypothetical protein